MAKRRNLRTLARWAAVGLKPNQRLKLTREGRGYFIIWVALLIIGLYQQSNLVLLISGLAAGPIVASVLVSAGMLRRLRASRRTPSYVFEGDPLTLSYVLENDRRWSASLALVLKDDLVPLDRTIPGANRVTPRIIFARVPGRSRDRIRWQGPSPVRGRYQFGALELITRSPFGLLERQLIVPASGELTVYPRIGQLSRRWLQIYRESTETRRGRRHDRSAMQEEYHGLRDYRPGDSPRWIHWRTTARLGQPMVKEFEQQSEQDLALLLDPWLPRSKVTADQREALEEAIRFMATACVETCRHQGRRLILGWTGPTPGIRQGPASIKLLHEMLEQLAVMRPSAEGQLFSLFDALPPSSLREALLVIVSTRPINLIEEIDRSTRLSETSTRGMINRAILLDASKGDLAEFVHYEGGSPEFAPRRQADGNTSESRSHRLIPPTLDPESSAPGTSGWAIPTRVEARENQK